MISKIEKKKTKVILLKFDFQIPLMISCMGYSHTTKY